MGNANDEICAEYYKTDKVKRMAVLWKDLHDQTKESPAVKAFLEKMQKGGLNDGVMQCCGYGRPEHCKEWSKCGSPSNFYESTSYCAEEDSTYEKKDEKDVVPNGCRFEYPVGVCALNGLDENSAGE